MTVILVHRSDSHAFIATDSFRWDYIYKRNIGPVIKLHRTRSGVWFAVGGSGIDRTEFARRLTRTCFEGDDLLNKAKRTAGPLFKANQELAASQKLTIPHFLVTWFATCASGITTVESQCLPSDQRRLIKNFDCMGPDTKWLTEEAQRRLTTLNGALALDLWAVETIGAAAERHPDRVGLPATYVMLRGDGTYEYREKIALDALETPEPFFAVPAAL